MSDDPDPSDDLESARTWLRRAAVLLRREPDLRRTVGLAVAGGVVLGPFVNALDYGFTVGALVDGLGLGLVLAGFLAFVAVNSRMESVFPDHGDDEDETDTEPEASLRRRYVRGEIDYETFQRRLDEKLREPVADDPDGGATDAVALLRARFARGDIDEATYRDRLATLRETAGDTGTADAEPDRVHADEPVPASEPDRNE